MFVMFVIFAQLGNEVVKMQTTANDGTEYTLRWRDHDSKLSETFIRAWEEKLFLDVTLACGNQTIAAHKLVKKKCLTFSHLHNVFSHCLNESGSLRLFAVVGIPFV